MTYTKLNDLLFNNEDGLLMDFHFKRHYNMVKLNELYDALEYFRLDWRKSDFVPKDITQLLIVIIPTLYNDLELYEEENYYLLYKEYIFELSLAIERCYSSNIYLNESPILKPDYLK